MLLIYSNLEPAMSPIRKVIPKLRASARISKFNKASTLRVANMQVKQEQNTESAAISLKSAATKVSIKKLE